MVIYTGFYRDTIIKQSIKLVKEIFLETKCLECNGSGIFDCSIPEQKGVCVCCKGTGLQYVGTI